MSYPDMSEMVERIYAAALDPAEWPAALKAIEDCTGSAGAVIDFIPKAGALPITLAGRFTEEQCRTYALEHQHRCRRIATAVNRPDLPVHYDALIMTEHEMDRDPVYAWLGSHGLRYYIGGFLSGNDNYQIYASFQRTVRQGHAQQGDFELFAIARRHLARAVTIADKLGTLAFRQSLTERYLDGLAPAFFMLGVGGRVDYANPAAQALLAEGDVLTLRVGRPSAIHPQIRSRFSEVLGLALAQENEASEVHTMRLSRTGGGGDLVAVIIPPRPGQAGTIPLGGGAILIVFDPCQSRSVNTAMLGEVFGLTRQEARVASWLATSESGADRDVAAELGITGETLRSHLKAIFRKMDVHRQSDVVRIVTGLAVASPHPGKDAEANHPQNREN